MDARSDCFRLAQDFRKELVSSEAALSYRFRRLSIGIGALR